MATQSNIMSDLATLTRIPSKILTELNRKECLCIGSAVNDALQQQEQQAVLNIGIGTLSIDLQTKLCKFIPSKDLKSAIKRSIDDKIDPVEFEIEQDIINKLISICDEAL